ncbi:MAG: hypothetical protein K2X77_14710 [Candidatus Obscuribacterales bacterium]|nr:hypothetical protein [Candidatus Obscuribacterales bacterium]
MKSKSIIISFVITSFFACSTSAFSQQGVFQPSSATSKADIKPILMYQFNTLFNMPYTESDFQKSWTKIVGGDNKRGQASNEWIAQALTTDFLVTQIKQLQLAKAGAQMQTPTASQTLQSVAGSYRYEPYSNGWQQGTLQIVGSGKLRWTNQANVSWGLTLDPQTGALRKDEGTPYQDKVNGKDFLISRDTNGNVLGFWFQNDWYKRI